MDMCWEWLPSSSKGPSESSALCSGCRSAVAPMSCPWCPACESTIPSLLTLLCFQRPPRWPRQIDKCSTRVGTVNGWLMKIVLPRWDGGNATWTTFTTTSNQQPLSEITVEEEPRSKGMKTGYTQVDKSRGWNERMKIIRGWSTKTRN